MNREQTAEINFSGEEHDDQNVLKLIENGIFDRGLPSSPHPIHSYVKWIASRARRKLLSPVLGNTNENIPSNMSTNSSP